MLKKIHRLTQKEFQEVWDTGKRHHNQYVTMVIAPSQTFKAAVVVGKKVSKLAVVRNHLRRQFYGVIETVVPVDSCQKNILLIIKPPLAKLPARERRELVAVEIKKLLL